MCRQRLCAQGDQCEVNGANFLIKIPYGWQDFSLPFLGVFSETPTSLIHFGGIFVRLQKAGAILQPYMFTVPYHHCSIFRRTALFESRHTSFSGIVGICISRRLLNVFLWFSHTHTSFQLLDQFQDPVDQVRKSKYSSGIGRLMVGQ